MDVHFNAYKARYEFLEKAFRPIFNSEHINQVNVHIDLDNIIRTLHRPNVENEFQLAGESNAGRQLISNIMNLIAHYRHWFSRQGIICKVFLYYTLNLTWFKNSVYITDYRKKFIDALSPANHQFLFMNRVLLESIPIAGIFLNYVDGCYLIDSKYMEPSVIPYYIAQTFGSETKHNLLISRDAFDFQYLCKGNWVVISPKGDNTRQIHYMQLGNYIAEKEGVSISPETNFLFSTLYPRLLSIIGDKLRNIPRLKRIGWKTIFKYVQKINYTKGDSLDQLNLALWMALKDKMIDLNDLNRNFILTDIEKQCEMMNEIDKNLVDEQLIDTPDFKQLEAINHEKFRQFPFNTMQLTQTAK